MMRLSAKVIIALFMFAALLGIVEGGPTVIRDDRVRDLAVTPVLGRGYTIATNTFQSTCFKSVVKTKPSYDFVYSFTELKSLDTEQIVDTHTLAKITKGAPAEVKDLLEEKVSTAPKEVEVKVETKDGKETTTQKKTVKTHNIAVSIDIYTYYSSVDESSTRLSDPAANLLAKNDIPGFFHSCGSYYVRTIARKASFFSIYSFEYEKVDEAKTFVYQLETRLKRFYPSEGGKTVDVTAWFNDEAAPVKAGENKDTFTSMAEKSKLTITSMAWGLGKDQRATLVAFDEASFKNAIKSAFISMMDEDTGKVDSIEVVPWIENAQFQSLIGLEKEDVIVKEQVKSGESYKLGSLTLSTEKTKDVQKKVGVKHLYEKKQILNVNSEFLAEIDRSIRNRSNLYYKAKICLAHVEDNWREPREPGGKERVWKAGFETKWVRNNKGGTAITAGDLYKQLTKDNYIEKLLNDQRGFIEDMANPCINKITEGTNIFTYRYYTFPECAKLSAAMGEHEHETTESYCMPSLYKYEKTALDLKNAWQRNQGQKK